MMWKGTTILVFGAMLVFAPVLAAQDHGHHHAMQRAVPLTEAGNSAFAAVQEVVRLLESDPATDWSRVDLEALRQHLVDMENMTLRVKVLDSEPIAGGVRTRIRATTPDAHASLERVLAAHPRMLAAERGWEMRVAREDEVFVLTITSPNEEDEPKIRGLGYIGVMVLGDHHAPHHWMVATGGSPHAH